MGLSAGGHLSHGHYTPKAGALTATAKYYDVQQYGINSETGLLEYDKIAEQAKEIMPKMIVCGFSAYLQDLDYKRFKEIADSVGAKLLGDISHISGLIAGKQLNDPFKYCDFVMTTTHKVLRGPRGALAFCRNVEDWP
jgi:glycine hydroxymethyltransferase